jgi:biotin carboxyl carrier protein
MATLEITTFRVFIAEYKTTLTTKYKNRKKWFPPNKNHILSIIPGTILEVFVDERQKVKAGETLMILEAMKMANRIVMPFDGTITKLHVKTGDIVPKRHLMIEIKPA